ncbi:hypothetical protein B0H63DRAFT_473420 [Podospora didyma]|uniref:Uncharacterized protein n=1 Tax=Podospora didyma TaxID=330526 RepID=A0AAE0NQH0_9PEZI|nr:hypothetical protein B0H63DRAFT_473420 [Podospora didyma]
MAASSRHDGTKPNASSTVPTKASAPAPRSPRMTNPKKPPFNNSKPPIWSQAQSTGSAQTTPSLKDDMDLNFMDKEALSVWNDVKAKAGNRETMIVAVVANDKEKTALEDMVRKKQKMLQSKIIVSTPARFQDTMESAISHRGNRRRRGPNNRPLVLGTLQLLVSAVVEQITYHIPPEVMNVFVHVCGWVRDSSSASAWPLRISPDSTYCGVTAHLWDNRPQHVALAGNRLSHSEGVCFEVDPAKLDKSFVHMLAIQADDRDGEDEEGGVAEVDAVEMKNLMSKFRDMVDEKQQQPEKGQRVKEGGNSLAWFRQCMALLAGMLGIVASTVSKAAIARAFLSCNAKGVMIKGPLGLRIAANCVTATGSIVLGAEAAGVVAAAATVYFVPWERVFQAVANSVSWIWDQVKETMAWVWEKIKEMCSELVSQTATGTTDLKSPMPVLF